MGGLSCYRGGGAKGMLAPTLKLLGGGGATPSLPLPAPMYGEADTEEAEAEVSPDPVTQ